MMSTMGPADQATGGSDNSYFVDKARGIAVVHLQGHVKNDERVVRSTPHDMHLHMLFYVDHDLDHAGMLNLDSGAIMTKPLTDDLHGLLVEMAQSLSMSWIDSLRSLIEKDASDEAFTAILFDRMAQPLWDSFNEIKTSSFIQTVRDGINDSRELTFNYKNTDVTVVEDRLLRLAAA
jgi:hypothetical protein